MEGLTILVGQPIKSLVSIYFFGHYPIVGVFLFLVGVIHWLVEPALKWQTIGKYCDYKDKSLILSNISVFI